MFVYYKALSKPVIRHKFQPASLETGEDTNFVSSVCWKKDSGVLLAANSLGVINVRSSQLRRGRLECLPAKHPLTSCSHPLGA